MKLSLNLQDDHHHHNNNGNNFFLKAKLPISIFNQPFTSIFTTSTNSFSDLSFSLSTNFRSGPSLKLSYAPSTATPTFPFALCLRSGLGLFGSPHNSPLVFSANFCVSNASPSCIIPTFALHFRPQLGHFSVNKKTAPSSNLDPIPNSGSRLDSGSASNSEFGNGFASDGSLGWQELKLEPCNGKEKGGPDYDVKGSYADTDGIGFLRERQLVWRDRSKHGFFSGVTVNARTVLPLTKGVTVNLRWGVNLPGDFGTKMPYLTVSKFGIEKIEEEKEVKKESNESNVGDMELLRGMCFWMKRDLEILEKENREMKRSLEEARLRVLSRHSRGENSGVMKNASPTWSDSASEFEQWRSKKNDRETNGPRELKKPVNQVSELESELQRAIKAASS